MKKLALLCALLFTTAAFAQESIISLNPSTGLTTGGTQVTIAGTGFTPQTPVFFGDTPATSVTFVSDVRLIAQTPPSFPGRVAVRVGSARQERAFEFLGSPPEEVFAHVLLPILSPAVPGAFESEFRTEFQVKATGGNFTTYGLKGFIPCQVLCIQLPDPMLHEPEDGVLPPDHIQYLGTPGRFIFVRRNELRNMSANLRVLDTSRAGLNFGTEIPVVDDSKFRDRITLLGVPLDSRFRNTLRIYSTRATTMRVTVEGHPPMDVPLASGTDFFTPAYGTLAEFPAGTGVATVTIEHAPSPLPVVPPQFWAFISVTNNETQMITTITPQP